MNLGSGTREASKYALSSTYIGTRLVECRERVGLSAAEVVKLSGVNSSLYLMYEKGQERPNDFELVRIAEAFHMSVEDMLGVPSGATVDAVGGPIARARKDAAEAPEVIAKAIGIRTSLYLRWEQGKERPTEEQLEAIAKYHGLTVNELLEMRPGRAEAANVKIPEDGLPLSGKTRRLVIPDLKPGQQCWNTTDLTGAVILDYDGVLVTYKTKEGERSCTDADFLSSFVMKEKQPPITKNTAGSTRVWQAGVEFIAEKLRMLHKDRLYDEVWYIATAAGVDKETYLSWEAGKSCPSDAQLEQLAQWYEITVDELLSYVSEDVASVRRGSGDSYLGGIKESTVEASFRKRLCWLMLAYRYSAEDVANKIGAQPNTVNAWTEGTLTPLLSELTELAKLFNTDVVSLVN